MDDASVIMFSIYGVWLVMLTVVLVRAQGLIGSLSRIVTTQDRRDDEIEEKTMRQEERWSRLCDHVGNTQLRLEKIEEKVFPKPAKPKAAPKKKAGAAKKSRASKRS